MDVSEKQVDEDRISMISQCSQAVVGLKKSQLTEVKSMNSPPEAVKDVLKATMILLGHTGEELEWKKIRNTLAKLGHDSVQKRVEALDFESVPTETRKRAMDLLSKYTTDEMKCKNLATATLHTWAVAVAEY